MARLAALAFREARSLFMVKAEAAKVNFVALGAKNGDFAAAGFLE